MRWRVLGALLGVLAAAVVAAELVGASRWRAETTRLLAELERSRSPAPVRVYAADELAGLPAPVRRYFRTALRDGQPLVAVADVDQVGTFNMSETGERWKAFTATERIVARRPGFLWDARIVALPGVTVRVHDGVIAGRGILEARLAGLLPLVDLRGAPEVARGELMRFLAEAAWLPTALLPSQGVRWEGVDGSSATATVSDGSVTLTLLFTFGDDGLIASARARNRGRTVGDEVVFTPWEGRWSRYALRGGMRVPLEGEVAWLLPSGRKPYWRGRVTRLVYEPAR